MSDPNNRLIAVATGAADGRRGILQVHLNRPASQDEINRLHEHLQRFGIRVQGPYRVVPEKEPCKHCEKGGMYTIVVIEEGEEVGIGQAWGDQEFAQDLCDLMNMAYDFGKEVGQSVGDDGTSEESVNARGG